MKSISLKSICYSSLFSFLVVFSLIQCSSDLNSEEEITSVTLTFSISGGGTLSLESGVYDLNSTINLVATPESGFYFDRWEGFESPIELEEYTFTATSDFAITAIFLPIPEVASEVEVYVPKKIDVNPIFMIKNGGTQAFLTDKIGNKLQTWNFSSKLGNELKLLSDGNLMGLFKPESVSFSFGGYGGILRKLTPTGETLWEYEVNTETELLHHDFEVLPNGNILLLIWELFNPQQASSLGYEGDGPIYLEKIIELNPNTFDIVWEWRSVDHLIQDSSSSLSNFGSIEDHPEKIDLNYDLNDTGDLMHANGLFYDTVRDMIYLSVNFYSEVWVIPHSYNTEETKSELGDLQFRFGNPSTYGSLSERLFFNNHHPTLVEHDPNTSGNFLIYMNGSRDSQSVVYEFILPASFDPNPKNWDTPEEVWSYTHPDLFFGKISGAYRLANGNTLICEGDYGYWEVMPSGTIVWKYNGGSTFWRGYIYPNKTP